jgi:FAD/FMN-containing dehydrogenase
MNPLREKLMKIIEPERISTNGEYLDELSWDALSEGRFHPHHQPELAAPLCAVAPVSTDEVQQLVRFANQENLSIVPFGGGSGLMGGALSVRSGMVLDLRRMNRILAIDSESRCAHVQAGAAPWAIKCWAWRPSWPTAKSYTRGRCRNTRRG